MTDPIQKALDTLVPLERVSLRDAVPFAGQSTTIFAAHGKLELDTLRRVITATPHDATKDAIEIPLENVKHYVRRAEKHVAKAEAFKAKPNSPPPPAPKPAPKAPAKSDVVKFVKHPETGKPMIQNPDGSLSEIPK